MAKLLNRFLVIYIFFAAGIPVKYALAQTVRHNKIADKVAAYRNQFIKFTTAQPFKAIEDEAGLESDELTDFTLMELQQDELKNILEKSPGGLEITLPFKNSILSFELVRVDIFSPDFQVRTDASAELPVSYLPGRYYRGTLKGNPEAVAAFSFFGDDVVGFVAMDSGNIVVGKRLDQGAESHAYIIYSDRDLKVKYAAGCSTPEHPDYASKLQELLDNENSIRTDNCVRMFYEVDFDIYQGNGISLNNTINWTTALHNNVALLYTDDDIKTAISEIFVWTIQDPYNKGAAITQLNTFKSFRASFNGDVGQLISMEPGSLGGVASTINGLCNTEDKYCYSDVEFSFGTVPVYSWTVNVVAHEFGHLLGSIHTHSCLWPGGAIDNCGPLAGYPNEGGSCSVGPAPVNGGTIMSYCHLTSFGVNFSNGFGDLPGSVIRAAIDDAGCLSSSCIPDDPTYCLSKGLSTDGEWIESVSLANLNNVSGPGPGYSDFTSQVVNLQPATTAVITLTPGFSGSEYDELFSVWIDYNKDMDFFDANEKVFQSSPTNVPVMGSFVVPSGLAGTTRMRVSMKFDTVASTCEAFKYGEVEDYTVSFTPLVTYCISKGTKTDKEWIDYFNLGTIDRVSESDSGYFDGTAMATMLALNSQNTISFSAGFSDAKFNESWKCWIDFNGNGDFENNEVIVNKSSNKKGTISRNFSVPSTATIGKTRLRLSMKRKQQQSSCDTFPHGEVEDYSIQIVPQSVGFSVAETREITNFKLFPNPAGNTITVQLNIPVTEGTIRVVNLFGQLLYEQDLNCRCEMFPLDVSGYLPGIYFMEIRIPGEQVYTAKWIKT